MQYNTCRVELCAELPACTSGDKARNTAALSLLIGNFTESAIHSWLELQVDGDADVCM